MTFLEFVIACVVGMAVCTMLNPLFQKGHIIITVMGICAAAFVVLGFILGIVGAFVP